MMQRALAVVALLVLSPAFGCAEDREARTYGTISTTYVALSPWDFVGISRNAVFDVTEGTAVGRTINGTGNLNLDNTFIAPLHLPEGALVTEIEAVFCDTGANSGFESRLVSQPRTAALVGVAGPSSTDAEAPGCVDRTVPLNPPVLIDNNNNSHYVEITFRRALLIDPANSTQFASMRVGYRLQVSAGGAQTWNDVPPAHPFFPFIQALTSSGITLGCGAAPPLYCPDAFVTRGQMAAFIARALGLHFAP